MVQFDQKQPEAARAVMASRQVQRSRLVLLCLSMLLLMAPLASTSALALTSATDSEFDRVVRPSAVPRVTSEFVPAPAIRLLAQLTLSEAVAMAKRRYPGRVLSAKRSIARSGKVVYKVKILSRSGEIRTLRIAADQGGA